MGISKESDELQEQAQTGRMLSPVKEGEGEEKGVKGRIAIQYHISSGEDRSHVVCPTLAAVARATLCATALRCETPCRAVGLDRREVALFWPRTVIIVLTPSGLWWTPPSAHPHSLKRRIRKFLHTAANRETQALNAAPWHDGTSRATGRGGALRARHLRGCHAPRRNIKRARTHRL